MGGNNLDEWETEWWKKGVLELLVMVLRFSNKQRWLEEGHSLLIAVSLI